VKALVVARVGRLSDRHGRVRVVALGWCARVAVLAALAALDGGVDLAWAGFLAYAAALASTEGAERALVGDAAGAQARGAAFGLYHAVVGIVALPGGLLFGWLWERAGAATALGASALLTAVAAAALVALARRSVRAAP
jgi:MFS family permease